MEKWENKPELKDKWWKTALKKASPTVAGALVYRSTLFPEDRCIDYLLIGGTAAYTADIMNPIPIGETILAISFASAWARHLMIKNGANEKLAKKLEEYMDKKYPDAKQNNTIKDFNPPSLSSN